MWPTPFCFKLLNAASGDVNICNTRDRPELDGVEKAASGQAIKRSIFFNIHIETDNLREILNEPGIR
ncbi:hypothetical protein AGR8A_pAt20043 [Agrobacterium fabrum str. J-07]|nr:hypothetical protein AGR8A_pAt20043 [Agrobacterium fabrum str. J-07]